MRYLLNLNSRTIHNADSGKGQCKLHLIGNGNKKIFSDYWEAKNFLPEGKKAAGPCAFCLGKDYEITLARKQVETEKEK